LTGLTDRITAQQLLAGDSWRLTPATMANKLTGGAFLTPPHIMYAAAKVATSIRRGNARLVFSFPPRHGKSELLSVHTPPWIFDWLPSARVMLASYGSDLATDFGRKARDFSMEHEANLNFKVRRDAMQVSQWTTTEGGVMYSIGVGGAAYGRGADVLLLDDYLKNAEEAASDTVRRKIFDWFTTVAMSRLEPGGSAIIVATRWDPNDLIGMLQKYTGDVWEHIVFPAIALEGDLLGRPVGAPLWPERYDLEDLELRRLSMLNYYWQSVYQQKPIPRTGLEITAIKLAQPPPRSQLRLIRYWDMAGTEGGGDYTAGVLLGDERATGFTYILDVVRKQMSPAQVEDKVRETAEKDGPEVPIGMEQEPGASGKQVVSYYQNQILKGYKVDGYPSTTKKITRAQNFLAACEHNQMRMVEAPWNQPFMDELLSFPGGDFDDQVDATAGGFNYLYKPRYTGVVWGRDTLPQVPTVMTVGEQEYVSGVVWGRKNSGTLLHRKGI